MADTLFTVTPVDVGRPCPYCGEPVEFDEIWGSVCTHHGEGRRMIISLEDYDPEDLH